MYLMLPQAQLPERAFGAIVIMQAGDLSVSFLAQLSDANGVTKS
jgi:hypothetical protein